MPHHHRRLAHAVCLLLLAAMASAYESDNWKTAHPAWIWSDDFQADRSASYFETDTSNGNFVRTPGMGLNGKTCMQCTFQKGAVGAGSLHLAFGRTPGSYFRPCDAGTAIYRDIYYRLYLKNQAGWVGGAGDKLLRALVFANNSWAEAAFGHVWGGGTNENYLGLDPASGTDTAGNLLTTKYNDFPHMRWLGWHQCQTPLFDSAHVGTWRCIEAHMKLNDAGSSNGVFELWIDGNLEVEETGLNWQGSYNAFGINAVFVENYWNAGSPVTQSRYIDDFVVSTQRIGPSVDATAGGTTGTSTTGSSTTGSSTSGGSSTGSGASSSGSTSSTGSSTGGTGSNVVGASSGSNGGCGLGAGSGLLLLALGGWSTRQVLRTVDR